MAFTKKIKIKAPHDPEVKIKTREFLEYYMTFPSNYYEYEEYGLVFCVSGFGGRADSEYQLNKLCPYIADKYNVITVGVRYHNDLRYKTNMEIDIPGICRFYDVSPEYFNKLNLDEIIEAIQNMLISRKISNLDSELAVRAESYDGYSSFGFMPAIDHLSVLFHIIDNFKIDKKNIVAFGTSYGGYIASLMGKFAPNTFSLIIDNSGFCNVQLSEIAGAEVGVTTGAFIKFVDNRRYQVPFVTNTIWSLDETQKYYFSDAHRKIRSLLFEDHRTSSNTIYCCYHSVKDLLVPISLKDRMLEQLRKYNTVLYKRVDEGDIDGSLFKNTSHGMSASLRKMFDISMEQYKNTTVTKEGITDFDLDVTYGFPCLNKLYNFTYSKFGINVEISDYENV